MGALGTGMKSSERRGGGGERGRGPLETPPNENLFLPPSFFLLFPSFTSSSSSVAKYENTMVTSIRLTARFFFRSGTEKREKEERKKD